MARFQELECWQEATEIAVAVYELTKRGEFRRDHGLRDQLRRAAVSIASNIAEGKERETVAELVRFLYIAKGSAGELRTQLHIALRVGFLDSAASGQLERRIEKISSMLGAMIRAIRSK